ncbi:MAG: ATP-binding protein [Cyanobacteria bacterium P01_H01_bin.15]
MSQLTLSDFLLTVPRCQVRNWARLDALWSEETNGIIAIIDAQDHFQGIIRAETHLRSLYQESSKPLHYPSRAVLQEQLESLPIWSAELSVNEWIHDQRGQDFPLGALVDEQGRFLGLIDRAQLMSAVIAERRSSTVTNSFSSLSGLTSSWGSLLDLLPLPLAFSARGGATPLFNQTWQHHFGQSLPLAATKASSNLGPLQDAREHPTHNRKSPSSTSSSDPEGLELIPVCEQLPRWEQALVSPIHTLSALADSTFFTSKTGPTWQFIRLPLRNTPHPSSDSFLEPAELILALDVTEQQQLYQELALKNANLAQLNRLKDEFLSCISHELKSPLTAVVGLSSLLKEQKLGELNQRQVRYASLIYNSGHHLMNLVNDLLDLTRLETGQLQLTYEPINVSAACKRTYELLKEKQHNPKVAEIEFSLDIEPDLVFLVADELRLRQMLGHLLDNAFKFTPGSGQVGLQVRRWRHWVAFTVWDTGIGIPIESQHLIFQKFQQLENPMTRQYEGTGLGLALTQRLAKAHGGDIFFISIPNKGSEFTLLLPSNPHRAASSSSPGAEPDFVLVVEAIPRHLVSLNETLTSLGYRVVIARSGTEALEKSRQLQPQAIFLDPLLPLLSGWDLLTLLKSDPRTRFMQVFILATDANNLAEYESQGDGVLTLPASTHDLRSLLEKARLNASAIANRELTLLRLHIPAEQSSPQNTERVAQVMGSRKAGPYRENRHRILEADSLEQAALICCVWQIDVVILDAVLSEPFVYLSRYASFAELAELPLIVMESTAIAAANSLKNLSVFPCLLENTLNPSADFWSAVHIAAATQSQRAC